MNNLFNSLVFVVGALSSLNVAALDEGGQSEAQTSNQADQVLLEQRLAILEECSEKVRAELNVDLEENPYNEAHNEALYQCMVSALERKVEP